MTCWPLSSPKRWRTSSAPVVASAVSADRKANLFKTIALRQRTLQLKQGNALPGMSIALRLGQDLSQKRCVDTPVSLSLACAFVLAKRRFYFSYGKENENLSPPFVS